DLATGDVVTLRQLVGPERGPISAALSPDGDRLALGSVRGDLLVVSLPETQRLLLSRPWTRSILQIAWSPDGRALATRDERGWVAVVAADGGARLALPRVRAAEVAWREADDGALELALVGEEVRVYRVPRAIVASRVDGDAGLSSIAVSADGARLALPDGSGSVRVLASDTGTVLDEVLGDGVTVAKHAAFRADGALAVLWPARLEVALLGPEPGRGPQRVSSDLNYRRVATLPGGDLLVAGYGSGLFRLAGREHAQVIRAADGGEMLDVTVAPGGGAVAWLSSRGTVEVAAVGADDVVGPGRVVFEDPAATRVALDAAGARLAIARGGEVALVDVARGELIGGYRGDGARFTEVAVTADGAQVAAGTVDGAVWLWRDDGALRFVGRGHGERVSGVAFGPRGDWLVSGAWDGVALRWDLRGLDAPAEALVAELEGTWGIDLEGATAADLR
ncbi:MAG: WD40 repeat domain-containing protein, partial [Myxococcales bacterium]|nr:WD40 repeat domain-containing protein [Myxococcales bacterium]